MADKAENENQSGPAGSERRAALRTGQPGGGFTRLRESGFPMRKASTLPDVSAYTPATGADAGTEAGTGTDADTGTEPETKADSDTETAAAPTPVDGNAAPTSVDGHAAPTSDGGADSPTLPEPEHSLTGQEDAITMGPNYRRAVYSPPDHVTTDPASPATQQIAAVPLGSIVVSPSVNQPSPAKADDAAAPDTSSLAIRPPEEDVARRANERDEAAAAKPLLPRILQVVVAVFFPVILLAAAVRAVTTPLFLWVEYHRPGFPSDSYGFSTEDRMTYGSYTVDYLLNWAGPRYLGGLVGPEGEQLFLDSEVGHMADVKTVIMGAWIAGAVMLVLAVLAVIYLARKYPGGIRRGLFAGSAATLILIIVLGVLGALNWQGFFTAFHGVFFADGTWTFFVDDTLIRLFPAQFWMDAGIVIAALVLMVSSLVLAFTWPTKSRRERSSEKLAAARARYLQDLREDF